MEKILKQTERNKNVLMIAGAVALGVLALAALMYAVREVRYMVAQPVGTTFITVSGKGEVQSSPDIAEVTFTLRAESAKVAEAQKQIKDKTAAAVVALAELKIEEKDIKTISYNSYPKYEYKQVVCRAGYCPPAGNPTISGYEVMQTVQIKVRDVDQVGTVFEKLGTLGINELSGPNFTIDDIEKVKADARGLAIEDAQEKAKVLAKQLGLDIIRLSSFDDGSQGGGYYPTPMYEKSAMGMGGDSLQSVAGNAANGIMQGENTTTANVTLVFEVKAD
jgi:uncharacterized protein YggE